MLLKRGYVVYETDDDVIETAMVEPAPEARPGRGRRKGAKVVGGKVVYPT